MAVITAAEQLGNVRHATIAAVVRLVAGGHTVTQARRLLARGHCRAWREGCRWYEDAYQAVTGLEHWLSVKRLYDAGDLADMIDDPPF